MQYKKTAPDTTPVWVSTLSPDHLKKWPLKLMCSLIVSLYWQNEASSRSKPLTIQFPILVFFTMHNGKGWWSHDCLPIQNKTNECYNYTSLPHLSLAAWPVRLDLIVLQTWNLPHKRPCFCWLGRHYIHHSLKSVVFVKGFDTTTPQLSDNPTSGANNFTLV